MLSDLPQEILFDIFDKYTIKSLINMMQLNHMLYKTCSIVMINKHDLRYDGRINKFNIREANYISNTEDIPLDELKLFTKLRKLKCHEDLENKHIFNLRNITKLDLSFNNKINIEGIKYLKLTKLSIICTDLITHKLIEQYFPHANVTYFEFDRAELNKIQKNLMKYSIRILYNIDSRHEWNYEVMKSTNKLSDEEMTKIIIYIKNNVVITLKDLVRHILIIESASKSNGNNELYCVKMTKRDVFFDEFDTINNFSWHCTNIIKSIR